MRTLNTLAADDAKIIIDGAARKAVEINTPMCIAVMDAACNLIAFHRMDGGKVHSINVALDKAYTAASTRNPTVEIAPNAQPGKPLFGIHAHQGGRFSIIGGGIPIFVDGDCVGSIGVSSGTVDQDIEVAKAGIHAFESR